MNKKFRKLTNQNVNKQYIFHDIDIQKRKFSFRDLKIKPKNIIFLVLAGFINAIGVSLFLTPGRMLDGGISGTAMLINYVIEFANKSLAKYLPMSIWILVLNIPFFIFGVKKIGVSTLICSLIAIGSYSLAVFIYQGCGGLFKPIIETSLFVKLKDEEYRIVCAIFGGVFSGMGTGITVKNGGGMDGIDVLSLVIHKKLNLSVGQVCMIYNVALYVIFIFLNNVTPSNINNLIVALFSLISYFVNLKTIDLINEGMSRGFMGLIISSKADEIAKEIEKQMGRGVTYIKGQGYYSNNDIKIVYSIVNRFELNKVRSIIGEIDPSAFVTFTEVSEILGKKLVRGKRSYK